MGLSGQLGQSRGLTSEEVELLQQVLTGAAALGTRTSTLRVSPLLNGASSTTASSTSWKTEACTSALEPLSFLGLLGPVCNIAHPAEAPACPPHPGGLLLRLSSPALNGKVFGSQRLHASQFAQLFCQVISRLRFPSAWWVLPPGWSTDKAAADAVVRAVKMTRDVLRGQIPETFGHGI